MTSVDNIWEVVKRIDTIDRREGLQAYPRYNEMMRAIADKYNTSTEKAAGVFAALSPNNDYLGNLRSAVTLLEAWRGGKDLGGFSVSTYGLNKRKAWHIAYGLGEPLEILGGHKVRNFYQNILNPRDPKAVTIDGHMYGVWTAKRATMSESGFPAGQYERIADDFRHVASVLGWWPSQLQATLWFTWKRIHRVVYDEQLQLFSDNWQIVRSLDSVQPYA